VGPSIRPDDPKFSRPYLCVCSGRDSAIAVKIIAHARGPIQVQSRQKRPMRSGAASKSRINIKRSCNMETKLSAPCPHVSRYASSSIIVGSFTRVSLPISTPKAKSAPTSNGIDVDQLEAAGGLDLPAERTILEGCKHELVVRFCQRSRQSDLVFRSWAAV
jgi:hypothetical protein